MSRSHLENVENLSPNEGLDRDSYDRVVVFYFDGGKYSDQYTKYTWFYEVSLSELYETHPDLPPILFASKVNRVAKHTLKLDIDESQPESYAFFSIVHKSVVKSELKEIIKALNEDVAVVQDEISRESKSSLVNVTAILKRLVQRWHFKIHGHYKYENREAHGTRKPKRPGSRNIAEPIADTVLEESSPEKGEKPKAPAAAPEPSPTDLNENPRLILPVVEPIGYTLDGCQVVVEASHTSSGGETVIEVVDQEALNEILGQDIGSLQGSVSNEQAVQANAETPSTLSIQNDALASEETRDDSDLNSKSKEFKTPQPTRNVFGEALDKGSFPGSHRGLKMTKSEEAAWRNLQGQGEAEYRKQMSKMQFYLPRAHVEHQQLYVKLSSIEQKQAKHEELMNHIISLLEQRPKPKFSIADEDDDSEPRGPFPLKTIDDAEKYLEDQQNWSQANHAVAKSLQHLTKFTPQSILARSLTAIIEERALADRVWGLTSDHKSSVEKRLPKSIQSWFLNLLEKVITPEFQYISVECFKRTIGKVMRSFKN